VGTDVTSIFLSHTDREELDRRVTTAILVELRRVGLEVWIDREHEPPDASPEEMAAGPTPTNPLFRHIVSALSECDAVLFVTSPTSLDREYVRLEFDPRVLFQEFLASHPTISPDDAPFYVALVAPLPDPGPWSWLTASARRVLNLTGAGSTPLILPAVLLSLIRDVAPEQLLPLDPVAEWTARSVVERDAETAPGCPDGIAASAWRNLEGLLGLGPLFPGSLRELDDDQLRYGVFRNGDAARVAAAGPPSPATRLLPLWTANTMLRSRELRVWDGVDLAADEILPRGLHEMRSRDAGDDEGGRAAAAILLQLGYALLTRERGADPERASSMLAESRDRFLAMGATPLFAAAEVLRSRADGHPPSREATDALERLGCDPHDDDLRRFHHGVLDGAFPPPRIEATRPYFEEAQEFMHALREAATSLRAGFAKAGEEKFNPEFWERGPPEG
jgi:hypothetical protein